jgi:glycosyltransferase involved in cell wall biosynthesis
VSVITPAQPGSLDVEHFEGFDVHRLAPVFSSGNAHLLPGLGLIDGFDLLHLHYPFFGGELVGMAARNRQSPLVITYHHDVVLRGWKGQIEKFLRWSIERWLLHSASAITFTSQDYAQTSVIRSCLHGYQGRIAIIPNGVDPYYFHRGSELAIPGRFRQQRSNDFIILLVARLDQAHYFKGVEVLLRALKLLPSRVKGLVVGDGDLRSHYEEISRKLNLDTRVIFTGTASQAQLRAYYQLADLTVLPSTTAGEAFGLVLLESLACGIPVIASDLPGVRTVVDEGQDGFLVEPGHAQHLADKILFLYQNKPIAEQMGRRGRKKVEENYRWTKIIDRLEEVYFKVLREKSGRPSVQTLVH